ncbi:MAG: hypothetical protein B6245_05835 [Desulfobacteraceae bacterium 4572_88]|nr:MAG: hypothetical protein B6245_05835 [Desulfobacteraceae bacterium 4572_88]
MKGLLRKNIIIIFVSTLICLTVSSGSFAKTPLRVGYLPILDHLPLLISHKRDNKTFRQVDVKPKMFKSWGNMVGALKAGKLDGCLILSPLAMKLFNSGMEVKTILLAHRDGSAITVKPDLKIRSVADFKGKAIAIPHRASTHVALLDRFLRSGGLSVKDVVTKVIAPSNMVIAMKRGCIDAFIVAEPFGTKAQAEGVGHVHVLTKDIIQHHVECIVILTDNFISAHAPGVQEWTDSLIRSGKFIDQDKLESGSRNVAKIAAQYLPHSEEVIVNGFQNPSDRISFSDLNPVADDFQKIAEASAQAGIIGDVDLENFIVGDFYRQSSEK